MEALARGVAEAVRLVVAGDPYVLEVAALSIQVSAAAVVISMLMGMPLGMVMALARFAGRRLLLSLVNAGMGLPPVVVGLFVWSLFNRVGPLAAVDVLFTPTAIVIAQVIIAFPIVAGLTTASIQQLDPRLRTQILALGASRLRTWWTLIREARLPLLAAVMAGFGGVISEVGAVLMVGGNIEGRTRVLTTAVVLETQNGEVGRAWALAIVLLVLIIVVNVVLTVAQQQERGR